MFKKMEKSGFYYGFPVILMSTKNPETQADNLTPISSTWTLNKTIVIGIGKENQGFLNLKTGSEVTFNLADEKSWEKVEKIAKVTGLSPVPEFKQKVGYTYCSDKFQLGGFTKLAGIENQTVRIAECPIQIEATVKEISERLDFAIIECQIKGIYVEEDLLFDDSHVDISKWQPLIYKFRSYTTTTKTLGENFKFQEHNQ